MSSRKPALAALYLALVFVAGAVAGAAGGYQWGRSSVFRPNRPGDMGRYMIQRFTEELHLRPEQVDQITPIITNTTARIRMEHRETWKQVGQLVEESNRQIRGLLDPDQQQLFDAMEARRRQRDLERSRDRGTPGNDADKDHGKTGPAGPGKPLSCRKAPGPVAG